MKINNKETNTVSVDNEKSLGGGRGRVQTEKWTIFHTGTCQSEDVIFLYSKHFMGRLRPATPETINTNKQRLCNSHKEPSLQRKSEQK